MSKRVKYLSEEQNHILYDGWAIDGSQSHIYLENLTYILDLFFIFNSIAAGQHFNSARIAVWVAYPCFK